MNILIIRHGDPDYVHDSLTPKGWEEAEALSEMLVDEDIDAFYVSPLGRARDTASLTLEKKGMDAMVCPWLREFDHPVKRERYLQESEHKMAWDWLPKDWTGRAEHFDPELWCTTPGTSAYDIRSPYEEVCRNLDELLSGYGYRREGRLYRTEGGSRKTIALVCHFGLECVLLSHLVNISPMALWHGFVAAPSSVTRISTEEREEGYAYWRINRFGDVSHLYAKGQAPSFAARFQETWK